MKIRKLHNIHEDQIAVILGAGPSLRNFDPSILPEEFVTFCVNSSIAKLPHPNYYVSDDQGILMWSYYEEYVRPSSAKKIFFYDKLYKLTRNIPSDEVVYFKHRYWSQKIKEEVELHESPDTWIVGARTSVGSAINIAYIMGIRTVLLLGFDNRTEQGKRYYFEFDGQPEVRPIVSGINSKKYMEEAPEHLMAFKEYWEVFAKANADKIDIYDCSFGELEVFPKISLEDAIEKFKQADS